MNAGSYFGVAPFRIATDRLGCGVPIGEFGFFCITLQKLESPMNVYRVTEVDDRLSAAYERLMPQLSPSLATPSHQVLQRIVASVATLLFCAEADGEIVGVLSLAWYDVPSGRKAWIEDVVVETSRRGCGAGKALVDEALRHAVRIGAACVMLTSRPSREAAHALYRKEGFEVYDTTLFRLNVKNNHE